MTVTTIPVTLRGYQLRAELALDHDARVRGLQGRMDLPGDGALLMCYPHPLPLAVWMCHTPLPLSVAFLDDRRRIVTLSNLVPFDVSWKHSLSLAQYVLETHLGWFLQRRITTWDIAQFDLPEGAIPT